MRSTGILLDEAFLQHRTGAGHPECPERLESIRGVLPPADDSRGFRRVPARPATDEELLRVHRPEHLRRVDSTAGTRGAAFDPDTPVSADSSAAARLAAGGAIELVDRVMGGNLDGGFAFVRPPGHHAEADRAMGFCLYNNIAVAAAHAVAAHGLSRVLIVDWDVHHGNGTQHSFDSDPHVLFVSTHQHPFYPGTGDVTEVGRGEGEGYTLNIPLPAGCGDGEYVTAFAEIVEPVARAFDPELVLVSAGFDAHAADPLANMRVTEAGYRSLTQSLLRVATDHCQGKLVAFLEGGYDLQALAASTTAVLDELTGKPTTTNNLPRPSTTAPLDRPKAVAHHYWPDTKG